ncbi:large conductance mechanosensitive channel protein MscL [Candidatus Dojkabacteria bacterium]|uniref:Large-conductance mechanosensitive channel n=1 Tax=Candidatus Dojkabacteria bacterium TaxID=2099670 RepID=A0A955L2U0_9BACT|nr:large conductance mechanosensitive channel protein MscL [Candidatus Dojkabacteria bacterium]
MKRTIINEFKEFATQGSFVDLAVGIIIGAATTQVVNSLVNDIIMPPIGYILGGVDFTNLFITLGGGDYESLADAKLAGAATINYGIFIQSLINFIVVVLVIFILIKAINKMRDQATKVVSSKNSNPKSK